MEKMLPVIMEIEMLERAEELQDLENIINEARVLIGKCSQVKRWNLPSKAKYTRKIEEINKKMFNFCQIQLQLIMLRNQRLIMHQLGMRKRSGRQRRSAGYRSKLYDNVPEDKLMAIKSHLESIVKELDVLSVSPPDLFPVPKICRLRRLFGLDLPLMEVKKKLLDDDDPVASLVVSAPPGCGKTTLVTQLCHDVDIKEKFEYIFFCDVSKVPPTFRTIVQTLLQHNGYEAPTFDDDSQAIDGLKKLLEELEENGPILLVLDDVCQDAESFLQKFPNNMLNFKILVTSWFEFPSFGPTYHLKPLGNEDAMSLLLGRESPDSTALKHEDLLQEILKHCYGFPRMIEEFGRLLNNEVVLWEKRFKEEENPTTVLEFLQRRLSILYIGSFLKEEKLRASGIIDMWLELYGKSSKSSTIYVKYLNDLAFLNIYKLDRIRRIGRFGSNYMWIMWMLLSENLLKVIPSGINEHEDGFYNDSLVARHSILRDLAQSKYGEHQERERVTLEIIEDKFPDWCLDLRQPISARLLSISTDDSFSSTWVEMDCPSVEALVLNVSSSSYALPNFIATMKKLKVVIIINDGYYPAKLTNLSCLSSLPNLKRIRFEKISINLLDILLSPLGRLEKLSMFRCRFRKVSYNIEENTIPEGLPTEKQKIAIPEALPSLQEIDIDHCYDLDELPDWVSEVVSLKKLSITNCGKFSVLPKVIGNLSYELPETTERLSNIRFLDISDCSALKKLPLEIGKLQKLEEISIRTCPGCNLPDPVVD
ncbi:hypothetical protein Bca52824_068440 [Brassica carinata]|uniref:RPW8 domain-containing protein n=1 Tax=Brassica carinata TaxID=52824 RepID=A0A8X7U1Z1_BRACI|nr:hypothetical protein Bca52824_068440 [Brassica carinata]